MTLKRAHGFLAEDRLFPAEGKARDVAMALYHGIKDLPIISPHGHTDPRWFADNPAFEDAVDLLIKPDHYLFRMLHSQGMPLNALGIGAGPDVEGDKRKIWHMFAARYHLFRATPTRMWLDHVFGDVFGLEDPLSPKTADSYYVHINRCLQKPGYRPLDILERYNIAYIATTEGSTDDLKHHAALIGTKWFGRVVTTYRPDDITNPDGPEFLDNLNHLADLTGENTHTWQGYLEAHRIRRAFFRQMGASATDHGHPTARTADLSPQACHELMARIVRGQGSAQDHELFRAQTLTEMALMSLDDGMVMQIHPGVYRNHSAATLAGYGPDKGFDIPLATEYVEALKPLLSRVGHEPDMRVIIFTLDESTYSRELAPLAGVYPALFLGPPWWFHDSPEGMLRYRQSVTETAGFYNTAGFNDDTRALLSIPARHDVARRMDCRYLGGLVAEGRLGLADAQELAVDLTFNLVKRAYKLS